MLCANRRPRNISVPWPSGPHIAHPLSMTQAQASLVFPFASRVSEPGRGDELGSEKKIFDREGKKTDRGRGQ